MKRALVTGGNRGIGRAIAAGLKAHKVDVTIGARNPKAGAEAAEAIGCEFIHLDLEDPATFAPAIGEGYDILINNAGILLDGPMLEDPAGFHRSMQVMVHGPYDLIRLTVPHMLAEGWGRIVNVSSGWGSFSEGVEGPHAYGVAKVALNGLTKALSHQLPDTIKVNSMCPGWVRTQMGGAGAPRTPEEGADTAIWLATLNDDGPTGGFFRDRREIAW